MSFPKTILKQQSFYHASVNRLVKFSEKTILLGDYWFLHAKRNKLMKLFFEFSGSLFAMRIYLVSPEFLGSKKVEMNGKFVPVKSANELEHCTERSKEDKKAFLLSLGNACIGI